MPVSDSEQGGALSQLSIEVTPAMIEAGRLALIAWYDGADGFEAGARAIGAAILSCREVVDTLA